MTHLLRKAEYDQNVDYRLNRNSAFTPITHIDLFLNFTWNLSIVKHFSIFLIILIKIYFWFKQKLENFSFLIIFLISIDQIIKTDIYPYPLSQFSINLNLKGFSQSVLIIERCLKELRLSYFSKTKKLVFIK